MPQPFTAHNISKSKKDLMNEIFRKIKRIRHYIQDIHLWGKREGKNGIRVVNLRI